MATKLGRELAKARDKKGWSLRDVERQTGIHNAHLSQIEKGHIERPSMAILWRLARLYGLDYQHLMRLAGHATDKPSADTRRMQGAALHAIEDLDASELREALEFLEELRHREDKPHGRR